MKIFLFFIALFFFYTLHAQDANTLIKEAEQLEASMNDEQAIIKYKEALKLQPGNLYIICKCSELCSRIGGRNKANKKKMTDYIHVHKKNIEYCPATYKMVEKLKERILEDKIKIHTLYQDIAQ